MRHGEGAFEGLGGVSIYTQHWLPDDAPRARILLAHGYAEHSSRYDNLVGFLVPRRYAIYTMDHRGHGKSGGERVQVESFDEYVIDLHAYSDIVLAQKPALPAYLLGHSMGAFVALLYAARYQRELQGLILSGGGIGPRRRVASQPAPQRIDLASTISTDPAVVQAYRDDPLVYHGERPPGRPGAMSAVRESIPNVVASITLPVLIMAGAASPLGDRPGSQNLYDTVGSVDKTLRLYDGLMHEIFNEPERERVFADLEAWLDAH